MNYYVTQSGSGNQNGTDLGNAWSVATFNASKIPVGGDTVFFSGIFTTAPKAVCAGNANARLLLDFFTHSATVPYISLAASYLTAKGGKFADGSAGGPKGLASVLGKQHDLTISGWTYSGTESGTIALISLGGGNDKAHTFEICDCHLENVVMLAGGDTNAIHDVVIRNNYARTSLNTVAQTDLIMFGDVCNMLIEGNKLINRAPGDVSVRHNDVIQCYKSGSSANKTPTGWVIRFNWIEQSETAGDGNHSWTMLEEYGGAAGLKIYGNVFVGSGTKGSNGQCCSWAEGDFIAHCYNNTYIRLNSNSSNTVRFVGATGKTNFKNNAMQWKTQDGAQCFQSDPPADAAWDHNWFYNTSQPSKNITATHGSLTADPLFTDFAGGDYSTRDGSPLRGAADASIGVEYAKGIAFGASWPGPALVDRPPGAWDVGAFQYSDQTPPGGGGGEPPIEPPDVADGTQIPVSYGQTTINLTQAGDWVLEAGVIAPSEASNSITIDFDSDPTGDDTRCADFAVSSAQTNQEVNWRGNGTLDAPEFKPKKWTLSQGVHSLYIIMRESGIQVNTVTFKLAQGTQPPQEGGDHTMTPDGQAASWQEMSGQWVWGAPKQS
jgi:hypothetical protein